MDELAKWTEVTTYVRGDLDGGLTMLAFMMPPDREPFALRWYSSFRTQNHSPRPGTQFRDGRMFGLAVACDPYESTPGLLADLHLYAAASGAR